MRFCYAGYLKVFAFISSVSTCMGDSGNQDVFETPIGDDPGVAMKSGYAQSKNIGLSPLPAKTHLILTSICSGADYPDGKPAAQHALQDLSRWPIVRTLSIRPLERT